MFEPFDDRLNWIGSQDLQEVSIEIRNVTLNDSGFYQCLIHRKFRFDFYTPTVTTEKNFTLTVSEKGGAKCTFLACFPPVFYVQV